jgi:hypothetical protein
MTLRFEKDVMWGSGQLAMSHTMGEEGYVRQKSIRDEAEEL